MKRGKSRDGSLDPLQSPHCRSVSRGGLRDLGNRLYEKGFNITTMPSVRRRESCERIENPLAVTLTSFESRKRKEAVVLKKQSTVFPVFMLRRCETTDSLLKKSIATKPAKEPPVVVPVGEKPSKPTRYLIDKFSGKFNINRRYNHTNADTSESPRESHKQTTEAHEHDQIDEFVQTTVTAPALPVKPESNLDKYIKLIQKKTMYIDEFLYLKKAEYDQRTQENPDPYDLKVVDYDVIKAEEEEAANSAHHVKEYFTISKKGLCHYVNNKPVEFMPLTEWIAERDTYNRIKNLKFFVKFRKWKTVKMWKRNVIRHKIDLCSKMLEERLFLLNPDLRTTLLTLKENSLKLSGDLAFLTTRQGDVNGMQEATFNLEVFKAVQERKRRECVKQITKASKENRERVSDGFKNCLAALLEQQKKSAEEEVIYGKKNFTVTSSNKANRRDNAYEQLGFGLKMSYEARSELRKECSKFVRFSYLVDFIFQQALGDIYDHSIEDFIGRLEELHSITEVKVQDEQAATINRGSILTTMDSDSLLQIRMVPIINMQAIKESDYVYEDVLPFEFALPEHERKQQFSLLYHMNVLPSNLPSDVPYEVPVKRRRVVPEICKKWLQLKPSCEEILSEISHCIHEGLNSLRHFKRWSKHSDMQKFVNVLEEWDDVVSETWEVSQDEYLNPSHLLQTYGSDQKFQRITQLFKKSFERSTAYICKKFTPFLTAYFENEKVDFSLFSDPNLMNLSETVEMSLETLEEQREQFMRSIPIAISIGMLKLDSFELRQRLLPNPSMLLERIRSMLPQMVHQRTLESKQWLKQQSENLSMKGDTIEEYIKQINNLKQIQLQFVERRRQIDNLYHLYQIMARFKVEIKDKKPFAETLAARDQLQNVMNKAENTTVKQNEKFAKHVRQTIVPNLENSLAALSDIVLDSRFLSLGGNESELLAELNRLRDRYAVLDREKERCVVYQKTLGLPEIDFSNHKRVREQIGSRIGLWEQRKMWENLEKQWMGVKIYSIDVDEMLSVTDGINQKIAELSTFLPENPLGELLHQRISLMLVNLPIVAALRCKYLKDDHWSDIKEISKLDLQSDKNLTLQQLIELQVDQYREALIEIAYIAEKEYELQCRYEEAEQSWLNLTIKILNHKGRSKTAKETMLLNDTAEFMKQLEDLVSDVLAINSNKYAKSIRVKAGLLKNTLINTHTYFTEWIGLQEQWKFFDVLFSAVENKRLHESGLFEQVDKTFRSLMTKALTKSKVTLVHKLMQLNAVSLEKIREVRDSFELVFHPINEYLSDKRRGFCRFYFADNEQLLDMVSNLTPDSIEKMALQCFKGLQKLNFEGDRIVSLTTSEGDVLKKNAVSTAGEVDQIFNSIQDIFSDGLRKLMKSSKVQDDDRRRWIASNPAQSVLTIVKVEFTLYTEITISNRQLQPEALSEYFSVFCKDLQQLIDDVLAGSALHSSSSTGKEFVRTSFNNSRGMAENVVARQSQLNGVNFLKKIQLVIAQDIFHRDILEELTASSICSTNQFLWQKHLRFYWDDTSEDNLVTVKHLLHSLRYGSDYVSLDDRCLPTLSLERLSLAVLFAFNHRSNLLLRNQRTVETVECLGATLGYNTHCYQCSPMTSENVLLQFMTGVYNTGGWGALADVHLLAAPILSVLAHTLEQVHTLLVKSEKRKDVDMKTQVGFILTVQANQPIPRQLSGLYRQVSLNQMHLSETLSVRLNLLGFEHFTLLARKLSKLYEVLLLTSHTEIPHSKFLRWLDKFKASRSAETGYVAEKEKIVTAVVNWLKESFPNRVYLDLLPTINDLFQVQLEEDTSKPPRNSSRADNPELQVMLNKLNLTYVPGMELHLKDLEKGLRSKNCVILTGEASCKSSLISLLALTQREEVRLHYINKSIIPEDLLFGGRLKKGREADYSQGRSTTKGILSEILETKTKPSLSNPAGSTHSIHQSSKQLAEMEQHQNWLVLEGFDLQGASSFPTNDALLNFFICNRKLLFNKGRELQLPANCRVIIECCSLSNVDPAIVIDSAIKPVQWNELMQKAMIRGYINSKASGRSAAFLAMLEKCMFEMLPVQLNTAKDLTGMSELALLNALFNLLNCLITEVKDTKQLKAVFALCIVWAFFGTVALQNRVKVDMLIRKHFEGVFPSSESVYKYYVDEVTFTLKQFPANADWPILQEIGQSHCNFVTTTKSLPQRYLLNKYISLPTRNIVLVTGPEGSGKTALMKSFFYSNDSNISNNTAIFHRNFTPETLQSCILNKMDTYRKKLVTPLSGYHETRILVDDVWMKGEHDASCLDVLRNLVDKQGVYCDTTWKNIVALRLAIISRCDLKSQRISRHCLTIQAHLMDEDLVGIFSTQISRKLPIPELKKLADPLALSALHVYKKLQSRLNRRFFSFSDLSRLINGLDSVNLKDADQLKKYWLFSLNETFNKVKDCQQVVQECVASELLSKVAPSQPLASFLPVFSSINRSTGKEEEIRDIKRLMMQTNERIENYNKENRHLPIIEYVTDEKTLEHIIRLYRNLAVGNCILVGQKNSGRSNTIKIVSYMRGYQYRVMRPQDNLLDVVVETHQTFQKEHCTLVVPVEDRPEIMEQVVQFFSPEFYESVGAELNKEEILKNEALQKYCHEHSIRNVVEFFKEQKGKNLHIVLLISEYSLLEQLMAREPHVGLQFSIDYFGEWPKETFTSLAEVNLIDERLTQAESKELKEAASMAMHIHREMSRHVQCSMKQYEDYIKLFIELFRQLNGKLQSSITTYRQSFHKSLEYAGSLIASTDRMEALRQECAKLSGDMNSLRQSMREADGEEIFLAMEKLNRLNREVDSYYDKLMEMLEKRHSDIRKTVGMLENIDEDKIKNLRNTMNPGAGIPQIMELLMIILGREPEMKDIKESLSNFQEFLASLKGLSARTMTPELVRRFREHAKKEEINNDAIKKLQFGMEFLNMLIAVKNYITERDRNVDLNNEIRSREKEAAGVREAYPEINVKMVEFDRKQKILEELQQRKNQAEREILELSSQKITEQKILQVVQDESTNWHSQYELLEGRKKTLAIDVLLMAGQFVYTSHLPIAERRRIMELVKQRLSISSSCSLYEHLNVDPEACESVTAQQLVFENMICINNSIKTFLMIDPDRKASEWLRAYAKQIKSVHQDDPNFAAILGEAITRGGHCVVEITKEMSPMLYGLICRIDEDTPTIRLNDTELTVSDEFKLHVSINHSLELTQELMDLFTVVSFELGEEAIDREMRMELLKKFYPEMLARQPEIIKRKVALKNELNNQQKALVGMFHSQFRGSTVSEKTVKDFESIKHRVVDLTRNIKDQSDLLEQYKLPGLVHRMISVAHIFRQAMEVIEKNQPGEYLRRWTKIPSYVAVLKEAVNLPTVTDEKSLLLHLYFLLVGSLSQTERELLAVLIMLKMANCSQTLIKCLLAADRPTLETRLSSLEECEWLKEELLKNREEWVREVTTSFQQSNPEEYFLKASVYTAVQRLIAALVVGVQLPTRTIFLAMIKGVLGEEYLETPAFNLAETLKLTNRLVLCHDQELSVYEYCRQHYGHVLRIRRCEHLEQIMKKNNGFLTHGNPERTLLLLEDLPFDWVNKLMDELDPIIRDLPLVVSVSSNALLNSAIRPEFRKVYLSSREDTLLVRRIDKLASNSDLIDKYSGSYHWQLHYFSQLLFHYDWRYGHKPSQFGCDEETRIIFELLGLIDNLPSETTTISKTLIKDELGYNETLEEWQCYNHLVWEVLLAGESQERLALARMLLSRISDERQHIIDRLVLSKRLSDADMDEYLAVDLSCATSINRSYNYRFEQAAKALFPSKPIEKPSEQIDFSELQLQLKRITFVPKKPKDSSEKILMESKQHLFRTIDFVRSRLRVLAMLHQDGHSTAELQTVLSNQVPRRWSSTDSCSALSLSDYVQRLAYQFKHLEQLASGSLTVDLSCMTYPQLYLEDYLREFAKRNNCNYEELVLTISRIDGDKQAVDGLILVNVHAVCFEWDRKGKCLVVGNKNTIFGEVELIASQKGIMTQQAPSVPSNFTGCIKLPLYHRPTDQHPILSLEANVNLKASICRQASLLL